MQERGLGTLKLKKQVWTELPPSTCGGCAFLRGSSCCTHWSGEQPKETPHIQGQQRRPWGDTPILRSVAAAMKRHPTSKVRSSRGIGKCDLGVQNEAGQRIIEFCEGKALVITNMIFQQHKRRLYTWHHQMANTDIRLIIFFQAKDGEALYSQQKQDRELTVAQIMNLLPNSDLNWRK